MVPQHVWLINSQVQMIAKFILSSSFFDLNLTEDSNVITLWLLPHRAQSIIFTTVFKSMPDRQPKAGTSTNERIVESQLLELSKNLPSNSYLDLCDTLKIRLNHAKTIYEQSHDYTEAYRQILIMWKNRTGGYKRDLETALYAANLGGISLKPCESNHPNGR